MGYPMRNPIGYLIKPARVGQYYWAEGGKGLVEGPANQRTYISINQSLNQSTSQSKYQSMNLSINQSHQSINQSINQPRNRSINQSISNYIGRYRYLQASNHRYLYVLIGTYIELYRYLGACRYLHRAIQVPMAGCLQVSTQSYIGPFELISDQPQRKYGFTHGIPGEMHALHCNDFF